MVQFLKARHTSNGDWRVATQGAGDGPVIDIRAMTARDVFALSQGNQAPMALAQSAIAQLCKASRSSSEPAARGDLAYWLHTEELEMLATMICAINRISSTDGAASAMENLGLGLAERLTPTLPAVRPLEMA